MPQSVTKAVQFRSNAINVDWDTLVKGGTWRLVKGDDFTGPRRSLVVVAHREAKARGKKVRTISDGEDLIVEFFAPPKRSTCKPYRRAGS
ncbi:MULTISPECIES: hypothetical protein [Pirellulaceae]|uniref:DUF2188 domain-containing protein n=1 Tax=Aporhodopirellula aestuarii TaxID=2950107 RepID=A0ABT0U212_9BACT|nr:MULTISPECIES: hypothetical protein [Pirellulaceae]MCM2370934.1 hypothetical protein [Aporhodopirellula aestuarii]